MRFAAKCEIELEEHTSWSSSERPEGIPTADYGVPAVEVLDAGLEPTLGDEELERLRIRARYAALRPRDRRPRPSGRSGPGSARDRLREGLLPGPGADRAAALPRSRQPLAARPRARRRRATRVRRGARLRRKGGRPRDERGSRWRRRHRAGVRPQGGSRGCDSRAPRPRRDAARLGFPAPVAQGIERCPAEAEVASSNLAGRIMGKPCRHGAFVVSGGWRPSRRYAYSTPKRLQRCRPRGRSARATRRSRPHGQDRRG